MLRRTRYAKQRLLLLHISLSMDAPEEPDHVLAEAVCLQLESHADADVHGNLLLDIGF